MHYPLVMRSTKHHLAFRSTGTCYVNTIRNGPGPHRIDGVQVERHGRIW